MFMPSPVTELLTTTFTARGYWRKSIRRFEADSEHLDANAEIRKDNREGDRAIAKAENASVRLVNYIYFSDCSFDAQWLPDWTRQHSKRR